MIWSSFWFCSAFERMKSSRSVYRNGIWLIAFVQLILHLGDALVLFLVPCILLIHPAFDEKRKRTNQQTDGSRNRPENIFLHSFHPDQKSRSLSVAAIVA